jgi:hypothetical protein
VGRRGRREMADLPGPLPVCGERREERRGRERRRKAETLGGGARVMERYSHRQRQIQRESKLQVHGQWPAAPSSPAPDIREPSSFLPPNTHTHTHTHTHHPASDPLLLLSPQAPNISQRTTLLGPRQEALVSPMLCPRMPLPQAVYTLFFFLLGVGLGCPCIH